MSSPERDPRELDFCELDFCCHFGDHDGSDDDVGTGCTHPGGHEWNRTPGEADEARLAGDYENDNIRCIHCGADGDA